MPIEDPGISVNRRTLLILCVAVAAVFAWKQVSRLDDRFFQPSLDGAKGLVLYEIGDYARAAGAYRAHLQATSLNLLEMGDAQSAARQAEKTLETNPREINALLDLGEIALEADQFEKAQDYFARVLAIQVDQPDALLLSSIADAQIKQYDKAIQTLNRALRDWQPETRPTSFLLALRTTGELADLPRNERPFCMLAYYHRYLRIFDTSHARLVKSYAGKAIRTGDHVDDAYVALGVVYDKEGDQGKALEAFQQAIEANSRNIYARTLAARLYSDRGDLAREYEMLKGAYEHAPADPVVVTRYLYLLSEKLADYQQALTVAQASLALDPDSPKLLIETGYLLKSMGEPIRALDYYRQAVQRDPTNAEAHERMAHILGFDLRQPEEAIAVYQTALALDPSRSGIYTGLGNLYIYKGDIEQGINFYEQAFRRGEQDIGNLLSLCSIYFKAGRFQASADCSNLVLARDPGNIGAAKIRSFAVSNLPARGTS